jgi:hypothetical protein
MPALNIVVYIDPVWLVQGEFSHSQSFSMPTQLFIVSTIKVNKAQHRFKATTFNIVFVESSSGI